MEATQQMFGWADPKPRELRFLAVDVENIHRSRKLRQGSLAHFLYKKDEKVPCSPPVLVRLMWLLASVEIEKHCWDLPIKGERW